MARHIANAPAALGRTYRPGPGSPAVRFGRFLAMHASAEDRDFEDAELVRLAREFLAAVQTFEEACDEDFADAYEAAAAVAKRMAEVPTRSLAGMQIKAIVFAWFAGGDDPKGLDPESREPNDVRLALSLARDLLA